MGAFLTRRDSGHVGKWTRCCWSYQRSRKSEFYVKTPAYKVCQLVLNENKDINNEAWCVASKA